VKKKPLIVKWSAVGIILLFVGTCIIPGIAQDTEKPLPTSRGNWLYVGGSESGNYTRIQDALDNVSDGGTVFVYKGTYYENIQIDKTVKLIGEIKQETIIDGSGLATVIEIPYGWHCNWEDIEITNFTIRNCGTGSEQAGISVESDRNTISNNIFYGNSIRVFVGYYCHNNLVINNYFYNNTEGIRVDKNSQGGSGLTYLGGNTVEYNKQGIILYWTADTYMKYNRIRFNTIGLEIRASELINVSYNAFEENDIGVKLYIAEDNRIDHNNFLHNEKDVDFFESRGPLQVKKAVAAWGHNYWGESSIYPKIIRGIREINMYFLPYVGISFKIPWFNIDWNPAQEPYDITGMT